jgi:tetratricopeptide (TPR) repeat protein
MRRELAANAAIVPIAPAATPAIAAIALAVALLSCACASPLAQGEAQFKEGRYPDAEETFASLEARAGTSSVTSRWSGRDRAEYLLYRGLTYGAVGDRDRAHAWLRQAQALEDAHPGLLLPDDARRMSVALAADPGSD